MKSAICMLFLGFTSAVLSQTEPYNLQWAQHYSGNPDQKGLAMQADASGNIYLMGNFAGTVDMDPSANVVNLTSFGDVDISIVKWNANGQLLWAKQLGGTGYDRGNGLDISPTGDILITGYFYGTPDFDPGAGTQTLTSKGMSDMFVLQLTSNGDFSWVKQFGGIQTDMANGLQAASDGSICVTGSYSYIVDFDPNGAGAIQTADPGGDDIFLLHLLSDGSFDWVRSFGGSFWDAGFSIQHTSNNEIWLAGVFAGSVDMDPGTGTNMQQGDGLVNTFASRFDPAGNLLQTLVINTDFYIYPNTVIPGTNGEIYLSGYFDGSCDFDPGAGVSSYASRGSDDAYLACYLADGTLSWVQQIGGTGIDQLFASTQDARGVIQVFGNFENTLQVDSLGVQFDFVSNGGSDLMLLGFDINGTFLSGHVFGSTANESGYGMISVAPDTLYLSGTFNALCDFDYGPGENLQNISGADEVFVAQYSLKPSPSKPIQAGDTICENTYQTYSIPPVSGATNYAWSIPAGSFLLTNPNNNSVLIQSGPNGGNITVSASNAYGSTQQTFMITVLPAPYVFAGDDDTLCATEGGFGFVSATVGAGVTFFWDQGIQDNTPFDPPGIDTLVTYTVTGTGLNGCVAQDQVDIYFMLCGGIAEQDHNINLKVFPVPTSDVLNIVSAQAITGTFQLYDLQGKLCVEGIVTDNQIGLTDVIPGMYVLQCAGQHTRIIIE